MAPLGMVAPMGMRVGAPLGVVSPMGQWRWHLGVVVAALGMVSPMG